MFTAENMKGKTFPGISETLGIRFVDVTPGHAVLEMDVNHRHWNPMGKVHGGVYVDIADMAFGACCYSALGNGKFFSTINLHVDYLRPFKKGKLIATADLVKQGRNIVFMECSVTDGSGKELVQVSTSCLIQGNKSNI